MLHQLGELRACANPIETKSLCAWEVLDQPKSDDPEADHFHREEDRCPVMFFGADPLTFASRLSQASAQKLQAAYDRLPSLRTQTVRRVQQRLAILAPWLEMLRQ